MGKVSHKAAAEGVFEVCRVEYETLGRSFRWLERRHGVGHTTLHHTAQMEGWVKLGSTPRPEQKRLAQEVEETILATALRRHPPTVAMPLNPAFARRNGRPRKHFRLSSKTSSLSNQTAPAVGEPVSNEACRSGSAAGPKIAPASASVSSPDQPPEPVSAPSQFVGRSGIEAATDRWTAEVVSFPIANEPPKKMAGPVQLLPERTTEEKAKLRITLAAIRAMMSVEQVQLLEHHEALLARYSHLLEVYLEPRRFVDVNGLSEDKAAEKIVAAQKIALRLLLPTQRDTLGGAIKVLTEAIARNIALKRSVAGLPTMGAFRPGDPANGLEDREDPPRGQLINLDGMDTAQLREVRRAMEALDRQQHSRSGPPVPPPPEPIDDLLEGLPKLLGDEPLPGSETPSR